MKYQLCLRLAIVFLFSQSPLAAREVIYEQFEGSASGTLRGGVTFVEDVVGWGGLPVPNRKAASFDGQMETCIDYGRDRRVTSTDFTVEAYVKVADRTGYAAIAADWNEDGDDRCWAFVLTPRGGLRFDISPDGRFHAGNKLETSPRLIALDRWYHVAAVSQGTTSRIYLNGRKVAERTRTVPGIFANDEANFKVGNVDRFATDGARPWNGCLDEVRISDEPLSPEEMIKTREAMPAVTGPVPAEFEMPFVATNRAQAIEWQQRARQRLLELVERRQPRHSTDDVPLQFEIGNPVDKEGYTLYSATFQGNNKQPIRCLLAVPDGAGPFPAMLAMHGHGGSCEDVFDPTSLYHGLADRFARGGYVVLAPSFPHREYCATMLWDLFRAVDILHSRPEVDRLRIGVAGLSMGGEWTMWIAACDPRLRTAVVSGWMCTTEGVFSVHNCECWELPGFVELMDVCEVHLLIAPRPLLFESAERDNCFPIQFTRQGYARVRAGYELFDAEDLVQQDTWPAGHEWHGKVAYPFVDQMLGGHAGN